MCDYYKHYPVRWITLTFSFPPNTVMNGRIALLANMREAEWNFLLKPPKNIKCAQSCITEKQVTVKSETIVSREFIAEYDNLKNEIKASPLTEENLHLNHSFKISLFNQAILNLKNFIVAFIIVISILALRAVIDIFMKNAKAGIISFLLSFIFVILVIVPIVIS